MPTMPMRRERRELPPGSTGLGSRPLDDAELRGRGHDAREREARAREERAVLGGGALAAARPEQHVQVAEHYTLRVGALVDPLRDDPLDEEQPPVPGHGAVAVPQDGDAALVVPVVDDPLEDVGVAADGARGEEVARDQLAAPGEPGLRDAGLRVLDD